MKQKRTLHKVFSMLMTVAIVFNMSLSPIRADGASLDISGLRACHTEHNKDCAYGETSTLCTHTCEQCEVLDTGEPMEKDCNCEPVESGEIVHGEDCQFYIGAKMSEAMKALIALVDELPNAEDITEENKETIIPAFEAVSEVYKILDNKDMAEFEQMEQHKKLIELTAIMKNTDAEPKVLECICPLDGGSTIHTDSACPFYGLRVSNSKGRLAGAPYGITVKQIDTYVWNIYANGNPIIIKEGVSGDSYSYIYIDSNKNGEVDEEEDTPVELTGVYKASGEGSGYFLVNSSIFGGCETANLSSDTFVTIESGKVTNIYGGGFTGNTGDVNISLSGTAVVMNSVFGGAKSGGEVGVTNINIGGKAGLNYVYGGAEVGTTGNTNIIIADSKSRAQSVNGGGHGGNGLAKSGDSTITVNKNIFFSNNNGVLTNGGWIYGGGYGKNSITANSTIKLNYDDSGEFQSCPMVCAAGNGGSITGNSTINIQKYAPSDIYCGGYSGNVSGTINVNVTAQGFFHHGYYTINGFKGNGETNEGGENRITFTNVGDADEGTWAGTINKVDNIILENSNLSMYGDNNNIFKTKNLTVGSGSSLTASTGYIGVTGSFTGGGSIIARENGFLSVDGDVSGKTTLDFESTPSSMPLECKIVTAAKATSDNFVLASGKTDYKLLKSGDDWKAVNIKNTVPLNISTSGDITYGKTMNVKVTVEGDVTANGEVKLNVNLGGGRSESVFEETKKLMQTRMLHLLYH